VLNTLALNADITATKRAQIMAQARFLRAYFHMELKIVYGNIIYADTTVSPANIDVDNTVDAWPKIEADLNFAIANLPDKWSEAGRANKSAAKAMLAKAYMHQKKHALASPLLKDLIDNGVTARGDKYGLISIIFKL
jgi:hypothetical protein